MLHAQVGFEIDQRIDMQAAGGGMGVEGGLGAGLAADAHHLFGIVGQVFHRHRRIIDEGQGFGVAALAHQQPQAGFTHLPDIGDLRRILTGHRGAGETGAAHVLLHRVRLCAQRCRIAAGKFHDQHRPGIALKEAQTLAVLAVLPGEVDEELVEQFHRPGLMGQKLGHAAQRFAQAGEMQQGQMGMGRAGHQPHGHRGNRRQGAFAAGDQRHQAEGFAGLLRGMQAVQVVAGHVAPGAGIIPLDGGGITRQQLRDVTIEAAFQGIPGDQSAHCLRQLRAEQGGRAVAEYHLQLAEMVGHHAIQDRMGAGGVVGGHPSDGRHHRRGGIRPHHQPMGRQRPVELIQGHPRLHPGPFFGRVDFEDAVEMGGKVHDQPLPYPLPGQAAPPAAGHDGEPFFGDKAHYGLHISHMCRKAGTQRFNLIAGGVGAVERPGQAVEAYLAIYPGG